MNGKLRFSPPLTALIVLAWVAGFLGIYFVGYEKRRVFQDIWLLLGNSISLLNVPPLFWQLWEGRLIDLAATALLISSAWGIGLSVIRCFRLGRAVEPLTHLFSIAVGLGVWAWDILWAGLAGHIAPGLYLWPAVLSLSLWAWHLPWLAQSWKDFRETPCERLRATEWFLVACLGLGFLLNLIPAFSPEIDYDALEYHLGALKEYQRQGHITFLAHNFYASMPSLTEMLYLWGITLRSSIVARLIHGSFALMTAAGLIFFGKRLHSRRLGLMAAALYYLLPFVTNLDDTARIDLATTFFAFLAGVALHRHFFDAGANDPRRPLWLAAWMAGLAMATKYTAVPVVLFPILLMLLVHRNFVTSPAASERRPPVWLARHILFFLLLAFVPVLPWLIKNLVFTGNPVFPIAQGIFHSREWDAARATLFNSRHGPAFHTLTAWAGFFTLAWNDSVREPCSSPILLLFAPLFLLVARPEPRWKFCAWYSWLIYAGWFGFTFRPWRFLFPAFPWFALLGGMAIVSLEKEKAIGFLLRVALGILLLFNLTFSFLFSALDVSDPTRFPPELSKLAVFLGRVSPAEYLNDIFYTMGWMNSHLPPDACVLYVGEARTYYARYHVLANTVYDESVIGEMVSRSKTPEDLLQQMKAGGATDIYVEQDELDRLRRNYGYLADMNWTLFNEFLRTHTKIIYQHNTHTVYEIKDEKKGMKGEG